ncbi:MAG: TM0996/MTH895 family glutaredoxin-like protein [Deltaproteobacteria bacterium]|nr:TM0996/MTH895 family glutaredoxin-like protein [Deltaproteobacteria bacterium]
MKIQIAGPGCTRCNSLEQNVIEAVTELGIEATISKLKDFKEYTQYGILMTPALVIDGKVVVTGKVPSVDDLKKIISERH